MRGGKEQVVQVLMCGLKYFQKATKNRNSFIVALLKPRLHNYVAKNESNAGSPMGAWTCNVFRVMKMFSLFSTQRDLVLKVIQNEFLQLHLPAEVPQQGIK